MDKRLFTLLFILVSTLCEVLFTILLIGVLGFSVFAVMHFVFKMQPGNPAFGTALLATFIIGLALSIFFYTRLSNFIIKKYGLQDKFDQKLLDKGQAGTSFRGKNKKEKKEEPKKTNMPSSVLHSEEEIAEAERWGEKL